MKIEILGVDKINLLEAGSLSVTRISKERRTAILNSFSAASSYLPDVGQDIKIYDDADNLIFGGCIKQIGISQYDSGNSADTVVLSSIYSDGYNQIAERRAAVTSYSSAYAGDIVEALSCSVLSGADGITLGTIDNGAFYTTFAKQIAPLSDIFDELAKASGFKWYIDDAKALYFTQESSTPNAAHSLLSTGTFYDFHDFTVSKSIDNYRNTQYVIGDQDADTGLFVTATAVSTAEIAARQVIEGGSSMSSGVYENVIRDTNIKTTPDAQAVADNALKQFGYPEGIEFRSYATDWQPSTKLRVKLPKYGIDSDTYYLIEEVTLDKINANELVSHIVATKRDPANFSSQKTGDDIDFISNLSGVKTELYDLKGSLGSIAYQDLIEAAMLGTTVIIGGYINTDLIQAGAIIFEKFAEDAVQSITDTLEIGSKNVLRKTETQNFTGWLEANTSISFTTGTPTYLVKAVRTTGGNTFGVQQSSGAWCAQFDADTDYNLSYKFRGSTGLIVDYKYIRDNDTPMTVIGYSTTEDVVLSETAWQNRTLPTYVLNASNNGNVSIGASSTIPGKWFEVKDIKLEKGNKQTDWTPNPEDQVNQGVSYRGVKIDAVDGFVSTAIIDGETVYVKLNSVDGLAFYHDDVYRGGLKFYDGEISLLTDLFGDVDFPYCFVRFEPYIDSDTYQALNFYTKDGTSSSAVNHFKIYGYADSSWLWTDLLSQASTRGVLLSLSAQSGSSATEYVSNVLLNTYDVPYARLYVEDVFTGAAGMFSIGSDYADLRVRNTESLDRRDHDTNSIVNDQLKQVGWEYVTGNGANEVTIAVSFPLEYDSAPVLHLTVADAAKAVASGAPAGPNDIPTANTNHVSIGYTALSSSGFTAVLFRVDPTQDLSASYNYLFNWEAEGERYTGW